MRPADSRLPPSPPLPLVPSPPPPLAPTSAPRGGDPPTLGSGRGDPVQSQQSPDHQPPHGDQPGLGVGVSSSLLYNPGGVRHPGASSQETVYGAPAQGGICPGGAALATPILPRPLRSKSDTGGAPGRRGASPEKERSRALGLGAPSSFSTPSPTCSLTQGGLCDSAGSRAGLRTKRTTSGNFLQWPRCPPPARTPPPGWVVWADAVTAVPGAGPPGPGGSRARRQTRVRGFFQGRGFRGARFASRSESPWSRSFLLANFAGGI